jgi:hypothetical protein
MQETARRDEDKNEVRKKKIMKNRPAGRSVPDISGQASRPAQACRRS